MGSACCVGYVKRFKRRDELSRGPRGTDRATRCTTPDSCTLQELPLSCKRWQIHACGTRSAVRGGDVRRAGFSVIFWRGGRASHHATWNWEWSFIYAAYVAVHFRIQILTAVGVLEIPAFQVVRSAHGPQMKTQHVAVPRSHDATRGPPACAVASAAPGVCCQATSVDHRW